MKKIAQTENLVIFESEPFVIGQPGCGFSAPRRLLVGFPNSEDVCINPKPAVTAVVGLFYHGEPFLDWLETAKPQEGDNVTPDELRQEFVEALLEHLPGGVIHEPGGWIDEPEAVYGQDGSIRCYVDTAVGMTLDV